MSILIKGMKMPESCVDCPMFDWDLEYLKCKANDKYFKANGEWRKGIEPTCPLIEVPEDVQPVKHGRWEEVHEWMGDVEYSCSVCGCYALWKELTTDQVCTEYCPHCGAKMDGEA